MMKCLETLCTAAVIVVLVAATGVAHAEAISFQEGVSPSETYVTDAAFVRSDQPDQNEGDRELLVGRSGAAYRSLLEFDLTAIETQAGGNPVVIDDVSLVMSHYEGDPVDGSINIRVLRLNENFAEGTVTWNSLTPDGGDTTATELSALTFNPAVYTDRTFGTTDNFEAAAADALANDPGNFLRLLLYMPGDTEEGMLFVRLRGDEYITADVRPELIVDFTIIPEPSTFVLAAFGLLGLVVLVWRRRK